MNGPFVEEEEASSKRASSVYLSYTHFDPTRELIPDAIRELAGRGITAMADVTWSEEDREDPAVTVSVQCDTADWRIAFVTRAYLERANDPGSGVRTDLYCIGQKLLNDASSAGRLGVVLGEGVEPWDLPLELQYAPTIRLRELSSLAEGVSRIMTLGGGMTLGAPPKVIEPPWDMDASEIIERWAAESERRSSISPALQALLDALFSADNEFSEQLRAPLESREAFLTERNFQQADAIIAASYAMRWSILAGRAHQAESILPVHLAGGILHARAPWTSSVTELLQAARADVETLRSITLRFAANVPSNGRTDSLGTILQRAFSAESSAAAPPRPQRRPQTKRGSGAKPAVQPAPLTLENQAPATPKSPPAASKLANLAQPDRGYARLDPDLAYGKEDKLDIKDDVEALAKMIAAWKLEPPLAVGLFGDWGSGKTFFMNKLREKVADLSKKARERTKTLQKEEAFCKYIAQVEFNAWHYSEGDLWAGMVHHIFANLKIKFPDEDESELAVRRKQAIAAVTKAETAVVEKAEALAESEKEVKHKETVQKETERAAEEAVRTLSVTKADLVTLLQSDVDLREQARGWLTGVGIDASSLQTAEELHKALLDARRDGLTTLGLLRQLWTDLRERPVPTIVAYGGMIGLPALAAFALANSAWIQERVNVVVQSLVALAPGALSAITYFSRAAVRLSHALDEPRRRIMEAQRERIATAQKAVDDAKNQRDAARRELDEAKQRVEKERKELEDLSPTKVLSDFLSERAGSKDYRDKLGMLAMIRGDFDRLSKLMLAQRELDLSDKARAPNSDEFCLNRIILYIDDLDRCEPDRVVKVLQAVHLLLAFPLFVVVVGVDARWVQRSLRKEYKLLLRSEGKDVERDGNPDNDDVDDETIASPHDYLEKIFQIPLWLRKLTPATQKKLLRSLIDQDAQAGAAKAPPPAPQSNIGVRRTPPPSASNTSNTPNAQAGAAAPPVTASSAATSPTVQAANPAASTTPPASNAGVATQTGAQPASQPGTETKTEVPESPDSLEHLKLAPEERDAMERFATLCGRSPRAIKRYVNCYRLFKAMLRADGDTPYVAPAAPGQARYELALFVLALVVGTPAIAYHLVELVRDPKNHERTFDEALLSLEPEVTTLDRGKEEWRTLTAYRDNAEQPLPAHVLDELTREIIFQIWRFSFRSAESLGKRSPSPAGTQAAAQAFAEPAAEPPAEE